MPDHTLTPDELAMIDATVARVRADRADAQIMGAKYDGACEQIVKLLDEAAHLRGRIGDLEADVDRLTADRDAVRRDAAREAALVSEARHERDTARQEAREARREALDLITGDRSDALHWAARQLRKVPMPTALTGPYWYGQGWKEAIDHLEHDLGGEPTDAQAEIAELAQELAEERTLTGRLRLAWTSARRGRAAIREVLATVLGQLFREDAYAKSLEQENAELRAQLAATTAPHRAEERLAADARPGVTIYDQGGAPIAQYARPADAAPGRCAAKHTFPAGIEYRCSRAAGHDGDHGHFEKRWAADARPTGGGR